MTAAPTPPKPAPTTATVRCFALTVANLLLLLAPLRGTAALALALGARLEQHQHQRGGVRVRRAVRLEPSGALGLDLHRALDDALDRLVEVLPALDVQRQRSSA